MMQMPHGARKRPRARFLTCLTLAGVLGAGAAQAGPVYWDWPAGRAFGELEMSGTLVDDRGSLRAGPAVRVVDLDGPEVAWCALAREDGAFLAGTGHDGAIHRVDRDGTAALWAQVDALEIFCLAPAPGGGVMAGTAPDGALFRIGPDGEAAEVGRATGGYVWALAPRPGTSEVWAATGSPAAVLKYDGERGTLETVAELPAENALDLAFTAGGDLLVATQGPGLVYRLDAAGQGRPSLIGETAQAEARRLMPGPDGRWFVLALDAAADGSALDLGGGNGPGNGGSAGFMLALADDGAGRTKASAIYEVTPGGGLTETWRGDDRLLTAAWHPRWGWLGGGLRVDAAAPGGGQTEDDGQAHLLRLTPPAGALPVTGWKGGDVVALHVAAPGRGDGDAVFSATQAQPGALIVGGGEGPHIATSRPLDGGALVRWGRLRWEGTAENSGLRWSVRTGDRAEPDDSWTPWSEAWSEADRELDLPRSRYLQWRVTFPAGDKGRDPGVTAVSVSARRDNRAPVIESFALEQLQELDALGGMNGGESVTHVFRSGLQAEFSRQLPAQRWPGERRPALGQKVRVFSWQVVDPDDDRLEYRLEFRPLGTDAWRPVRGASDDAYPFAGGIGSWDTSEAPDGVYEVRLTASDGPDNPAAEAATADRILGPVVVDNTPPRIEKLKLERTGRGFRVTFTAEDAGAVLGDARIHLPDGAVERLDPADGICDSRREAFAADIAWPRPGQAGGDEPWRVRVEVRDLAGNPAAGEAELE